MSDRPPSKYPTEKIPDEDSLFRRYPENRAFDNGKPRPGAFSDKGIGMSSNWAKHTEASNCRGNPATCGVAQLAAAPMRQIRLEVRHTPRDDDQSHSDVIGEKDDETRLALSEMADVIYKPIQRTEKRKK